MLAEVVDHAELDAGPTKLGRGTARLCLATRTVRPIEQLIRFVVDPEGRVVPDLKRRLPGRGVWVSADRDKLADLIRRKGFARGFKREVKADPGLVEQVELLMERAALDALAMAGKAGDVVAGFTKVEKALAEAHVVAALHARDGAEDGVRKLEAVARRRGDTPDRIVTIRTFTSAQLDLALGRPNVVHAALLAGTASNTFLVRWALLEGFRTGQPGHPEGAGAPAMEPPATAGRMEDQDRLGPDRTGDDPREGGRSRNPRFTTTGLGEIGREDIGLKDHRSAERAND